MIEITLNDRELQRALSALRGRIVNLRPALAEAAQVIRNVAMEAFDTSRSPVGEPWAPLRPASIVARARRRAPSGYAKNRARTLARFANGKPLLDTGQLRNSIQIQRVTDAEAVVGTKLPYAAIHQFGGKAGRGRRVSIPARPFLGIDREGRLDILDIIRRHLEESAR